MGIEIRPIRNAQELDAVYRLTHDNYVELGYAQPQPDGRLIHYPQFDHIAETMILVAVSEGQIIGSISVTIDGPRGLPEDIDFRPECNRLRKEGHIVGAVWRLITHKSHRTNFRLVLKMMEEMMFKQIMAGTTSLVFVVNPRHQGAYHKLFKAKSVYSKVGTEGLSNAPGVLMRIDLPESLSRLDVLSQIRQFNQTTSTPEKQAA